MRDRQSFPRNWPKIALFAIGTTRFNPNGREQPLQRARDYRWQVLSAVRAGGHLIALFATFLILLAPASAASGSFADLDGNWSGTGILRPSNGAAERIRCNAHYGVIGQHQIKLQLRCDSDSYRFDLGGDFTADERGHLSGAWTERTRSVSGTIIGEAQGNRMLVRAAAPGFYADLVLVTRGRRQSATIHSEAGNMVVKASLTLTRR